MLETDFLFRAPKVGGAPKIYLLLQIWVNVYDIVWISTSIQGEKILGSGFYSIFHSIE